MDIITLLELNKIQPVNIKVEKKTFYEQNDFNISQKQLFMESIEGIQISHILNSKNINIPPFEDEEHAFQSIMYMTVFLRNRGYEEKIGLIINQLIPNSIVLIFEYECGVRIASSMKRLNKSDGSRVVLEDTNITGWVNINNLSEGETEFFESIKLSSLPYTNFYDFYLKIHERIYIFNNRKYFNSIDGFYDEDLPVKKKIISEIETLETELQRIVKAIKKETQFRNKAKLNVHAKEIKGKIEKLENGLKREKSDG